MVRYALKTRSPKMTIFDHPMALPATCAVLLALLVYAAVAT
jgi:hypothetical protein